MALIPLSVIDLCHLHSPCLQLSACSQGLPQETILFNFSVFCFLLSDVEDLNEIREQ